MIRRTFEAIGLTAFMLLVLFQYAPGIAGRLGLPAAHAFECPGTYWQLPGLSGWVRCEDLDLHGAYLRRGLTQHAAALRTEVPEIRP